MPKWQHILIAPVETANGQLGRGQDASIRRVFDGSSCNRQVAVRSLATRVLEAIVKLHCVRWSRTPHAKHGSNAMVNQAVARHTAVVGLISVLLGCSTAGDLRERPANETWHSSHQSQAVAGCIAEALSGTRLFWSSQPRRTGTAFTFGTTDDAVMVLDVDANATGSILSLRKKPGPMLGIDNRVETIAQKCAISG